MLADLCSLVELLLDFLLIAVTLESSLTLVEGYEVVKTIGVLLFLMLSAGSIGHLV
jgi:hypothetical protein